MPKRRPLKERFYKNLPSGRDPDKCWEWQGACTSHGYGNIGAGGNCRKVLSAHRVAWQLANDQKIPEGMHVLHSCDNPSCCNPSHLRLGTNADNVRDKVERGRTPCGESHYNAKVPDEIVCEAVALANSGLTHRAVALRIQSKGYSCSYPSVCRWINGKTRHSAFKQIQEDRVHPDTPSNTTCEVDQVESLQGKGEQLCLFTT